MAAPMGYAIAAFGPKGVGPPLAFAIGAFPLDQVQAYLRQAATKNLNFQYTGDAGKDRVIALDGVDQPTADRLSQADILTVAQFAYSDPVQVSMKTNINFDAIIDGQNQALLRLYLGDKGDTARPMGIRGAMDAKSLLDDLASSDDTTKQNAQAAFDYIAGQLAVEPEALKRAFAEVAVDPYTIFLWNVWAKPRPRRLPKTSRKPPAQPEVQPEAQPEAPG